MNVLRFTLPGAPRTKKTSNRIVHIGPKRKLNSLQESIISAFTGGAAVDILVRQYGYTTVYGAFREGLRSLAPGFNKILPSEAHEEWFKTAMQYGMLIRGQLQRAGATLPISGPVEVEAVFYRDANRGDLLGFEQALADWMQAPKFSEPKPGKPPRQLRDGAGIIVDDVQVVSWDGSRLAKDAANPRIEVTIYPIEGQLDLAEPEVQNKYDVIRNSQ